MSYFKYFLSLMIFICFLNVNSQTPPLNIQQLAHVPNSSLMVPSDLSDIWGWVDSAGMNMPLLELMMELQFLIFATRWVLVGYSLDDRCCIRDALSMDALLIFD